MEQKLRESEEKYRRVVENANEAIVVVQDGILEFFNPKTLEITGYSHAELASQPFAEFIHLDDRKMVVERYLEWLQGEQLADVYSFRIIDKKGTIRWVEVRVVLIDWEGKLSTLVFLNDITERKRTEQLLKSLNQVTLAMEKALTPEEIFTVVAEELEKLGFSCVLLPTDESRTRLFSRYVRYETRAIKAAEKLAGLKRQDFSFPIESADVYQEVVWQKKTVFVEDKEGVLRQVLPGSLKQLTGRLVKVLKVPKAIVAPLVVEGEVVGVFSVQSDDLTEGDVPTITAFAHQVAAAWRKAQLLEQAQREVVERRRAEEELRQSEEKFRDIVEMAPEGIVTVDLKGMITSCNRTFTELSGFSEDEIVGKHFSKVSTLRAKDIPKYVEIFASLLRGKVPKPFEITWIHKDGTLRLAEIRISLMRKGGKVSGIQTIAIDITERKRAERLLQALNQVALAMGKALTPEEIFAAVAEEFKGLGFSCMVLPTDESRTRLFTRYVTYETQVLRAAEKLAGLKHKDFSFPIKDVDIYKEVVWERKTVFLENAEDALRQVLPRPMQGLAGQLTRMLKVPKAIAAPLITEDDVVGVLSVQSEDLTEDDVPAITAFAHQMAAVWRKAQLFERAQQEIAERIRVEEELRQSEERYRNIVELAPEGIVTANLKGVVTTCNTAFLRLTGFSRDEIVGKHFSKVPTLHGIKDIPRYIKMLDSAVRGKIPEPFEFIWVHKDGTTRWGEAHVGLMKKGSKITGFQSILLDITERKRAEEEILRLQYRLQNVADSMPSALITLDSDGRVLLWNPAAEALVGQAAVQVQGQSLWRICPGLTRYREMFERVVSEGQVVHRHKEQLDTDAGVIYRDVSVFPLVADDGTIEGVVLRIDDVTRRVQLEEAMLQSAKMASVGGLAAGVAHEINNPLGAMMQSAQVLQMAFDPQRPRTRERLQNCGVDPEGLNRYLQERELMEYLNGIRTAGWRAAKIVSDLLSFSHKGSADIVPHDLNTLVGQTLELAATDYDLRKKYDFRDIEIVHDLAPGLPQVVCDKQQIQQVVLNLVRNAAQAMAREMEKGDSEYRPRLTLRTSLPPGSSFVRLEVENNGPSIPEAVRARLFEPFFTTKDMGEGTGLGLWLCWSIVVERHDGRIWAESIPPVPSTVEGSEVEGPGEDRGVCFVVELPVIQ